ncbi:MAG: gliding motility-associated ABC transporter ATP-binding subunit GldA [Bacteroidetes bacterium]|nr:MAG: gliding motility-associated ABC transporter ATP-binding subunit GldA [Bacteroidota bacterium]
MSIYVKHITKLYGEQKALDNVSFEIRPGEIVGFLGPNGAGKSTMMKILTCFIPQTYGKAEVCGYDVGEQSIEVRKNIGYLPEHNPLYLEMYVKEYLLFVSGLYKVPNAEARVKEMINLVGLEIEQHKKIGALSKGYRQRVGLAQAIIHNPKVLILDEPTTGLDPNQIIEIRNLIKKIGKEKTVMMSTHIMQEVEAVCDRVIIINRGKIVADDATDNIRKSAKNKLELTVEFSSDIDLQLIEKIDGVRKVEKHHNIYKISTAPDKDIRKDIFLLAKEQNVFLLTLSQKENKLEDIFKELTQ